MRTGPGQAAPPEGPAALADGGAAPPSGPSASDRVSLAAHLAVEELQVPKPRSAGCVLLWNLILICNIRCASGALHEWVGCLHQRQATVAAAVSTALVKKTVITLFAYDLGGCLRVEEPDSQ